MKKITFCINLNHVLNKFTNLREQLLRDKIHKIGDCDDFQNIRLLSDIWNFSDPFFHSSVTNLYLNLMSLRLRIHIGIRVSIDTFDDRQDKSVNLFIIYVHKARN